MNDGFVGVGQGLLEAVEFGAGGDDVDLTASKAAGPRRRRQLGQALDGPTLLLGDRQRRHQGRVLGVEAGLGFGPLQPAGLDGVAAINGMATYNHDVVDVAGIRNAAFKAGDDPALVDEGRKAAKDHGAGPGGHPDGGLAGDLGAVFVDGDVADGGVGDDGAFGDAVTVRCGGRHGHSRRLPPTTSSLAGRVRV